MKSCCNLAHHHECKVRKVKNLLFFILPSLPRGVREVLDGGGCVGWI